MFRIIALAAVFFVLSCTSSTPEMKKDVGISVQLWSVRDACKKDFEGTLKGLSDMGMDGVEFAGYYHYAKDPEKLKELLDKLNLKPAATHIRTKDLLPENIEATIAFHKVLGCKYLVVGMDKKVFTTDESNAEIAKVFNQAHETLKKHGMKAGYHNHTQDMENCGPCSDTTWWELLGTRTDKDFIMQQDVGWTWNAGKDPVKMVKKHPQRTISTHFRPHIPKSMEGKGYKPFIGENGQDWEALINACLSNGGTEWFSVEQTYYPDGMTSMQAVERSFNNLIGILKKMGIRK
ncbi:MAG: sugar phosphate isomerase/epimerase [Lentisphaeraceae bacterium]|nr:sugar phosphate isomerase/epimerase [Lentisphaeraceae bacterium]